MSGIGPSQAYEAPPFEATGGAQLRGRSPLAHLLHALNQPLTGLQCSLELAVASPRSQDEYARTLHEALELACRMRLLVEALRDLTDAQQPAEARQLNEEVGEREALRARLGPVLHDTVEELHPVAAAKNVRLRLAPSMESPAQGGSERVAARPPAPVTARTTAWTTARIRDLLFRLLDSIISLAAEASDVEIAFSGKGEGARSIDSQVDSLIVDSLIVDSLIVDSLIIDWRVESVPKHSPFSAPELGLLVAQAAWEQIGGHWSHTVEGAMQRLTLRDFPGGSR